MFLLALEGTALPDRQTYRPLLFFALPVAVLLLILVSGINAPLILLLYVVIVMEGGGLLLWIPSKIRRDEGSPRNYPPTPYRSYSWDRNKAEILLDQLKYAEKKPGESSRYYRYEIARVLQVIVTKDTELSPELEFLLKPPTGEDADKFDYLSSLDHVVTKLESE
jgi:hypothetical protein